MSITKLIILVFVLASILVWRFHDFYTHEPFYKGGAFVRLETTLSEEPDLSNTGQKFSVKTPLNQFISINAQSFPRYYYGQVVEISGKLQAKQFDDGSMFYSMYYPRIVVKADSANVIAAWANMIRERSKEVYEQTLPPTSASLLMGIVFGAKEHFSTDFFSSLKVTGVLHVIAASGMNVTFVAAAMLYSFGLVMRRQYALLLGCIGIIFYVFLVGFQASIIRAALMAMLAFGASLLGKQSIASWAVVISGYVMLLWQPSFLYDLGFQLSFMATLGILFIQPMFPFAKNILLEPIATTTAAQIGTLPVLLGAFGKFGLLSILVNALVLWTVPIDMLLGSLASILALVFPPLAQLLLIMTLPFLLFFEAVVAYFGAQGWVVSLGSLPWVFAVGYYLVIAAVILIRKSKLQPIIDERLLLERP